MFALSLAGFGWGLLIIAMLHAVVSAFTAENKDFMRVTVISVLMAAAGFLLLLLASLLR
jgi:hypothetical protein